MNFTAVNGGPFDALTGYSTGPATFDDRFPTRLSGDDAMSSWRNGLDIPNEPQLASVGGVAQKGGSIIAKAAKDAGITGGTIAPDATTGKPGATTNAPGAATNWVARGSIVVLGFVFVAVGLSQFGAGQRVIREALKGI